MSLFFSIPTHSSILVHFSLLCYSSSIHNNWYCSCINHLFCFQIFLILCSIYLLSYLSFLYSSQNQIVTHPGTYIPFDVLMILLFFPCGNSIPSLLTTLPLFISNIAHFEISLLKILTICTRKSSFPSSCHRALNKSLKSKWLIFL